MKKVRAWAPIIGVMLLLWIAAVYALGYVLKLGLPFLPKAVEPDWSAHSTIMNTWQDIKVYQSVAKPTTVEEIIEETPIVDVSSSEFFSLFSELDRTSFESYAALNGIDTTDGYGKVFIDKVTVDNIATGITTTQGDNVLAVDTHDNLMIVGVKSGEATGKLTILKEKQQLGMGLVQDINYWEPISELAKSEDAILAIGANSYKYHEAQNYFTVFGLMKRNGEVIRKSTGSQNIIGFTQDGTMEVGTGTNIDGLHMATEFSPILIDDTVAADGIAEDTSRMARTAIGQTENGTTLLLVMDGGIAGSNNGATFAECLDILTKYGAINAANLVGGNRTTMLWNGNVVNKAVGYTPDTILLPNAYVVYAGTGDKPVIDTPTLIPDITNPETTEPPISLNPPSADIIGNGATPEPEKGAGVLYPR